MRSRRSCGQPRRRPGCTGGGYERYLGLRGGGTHLPAARLSAAGALRPRLHQLEGLAAGQRRAQRVGGLHQRRVHLRAAGAAEPVGALQLLLAQLSAAAAHRVAADVAPGRLWVRRSASARIRRSWRHVQLRGTAWATRLAGGAAEEGARAVLVGGVPLLAPQAAFVVRAGAQAGGGHPERTTGRAVERSA